MVPCSWGPVNAYAVFALLNGSGMSKIHQAIIKVKKQGKTIGEVAKCFPSPSSLRAAIYFTIVEYQSSKPKDKNKFKEVLEFLLDILRHLIKRDLFAYKSNIAHSELEIGKILTNIKWQSANPTIARDLGKFYNSLWSLVFALYRDFFPQDSHEIFGPYDASNKFGDGSILLVKYFPKIRSIELWPEMSRLKYSEVKIYQVYKNVEFSCEVVGMHSLYEGDLINGLRAYSVEADGKLVDTNEEIKELTDYFVQVAVEQSSAYDRMSKEELKKKVLEWLCYQYVDFFRLAEMDWRPTAKMIAAVKGKPVPDRFEMQTVPTYEQYVSNPEFEIYWLRDLYKK